MKDKECLIRQQEFDIIKKWFVAKVAKKAKVLEIGGGNGLLAKCLADMGLDVVSIDPEPHESSYFLVRKGDCTNLEFEDKSFDIIFSSYVLEHIIDLGIAFSEMKRVLKNDGFMVHIVPTHYCMIFTLVLQPIGYLIKIGLMVKYGLKFITFAVFGSEKSRWHPLLNKENVYEAFKYANPIRFFISWPHGTGKNCFSEICNWRPKVWQKKFEQVDLKIKNIISFPVTRSLHAIWPFRFMRLRFWLSDKGLNTSQAYLVYK